MLGQFCLGEQPIIAFVASSDPAAARAFYRDQLGLRLASEELPFALVFDAYGTMLRVTFVKEVIPRHTPYLAGAFLTLRSPLKRCSRLG